MLDVLIYFCVKSALELADKSTLHGEDESYKYSKADASQGYIGPENHIQAFFANEYNHYCRCKDAYDVYNQEWHKVVALALKVSKE